MQEMKKVLLMECISITTFLQFLEVLYDDIYIERTFLSPNDFYFYQYHQHCENINSYNLNKN